MTDTERALREVLRMLEAKAPGEHLIPSAVVWVRNTLHAALARAEGEPGEARALREALKEVANRARNRLMWLDDQPKSVRETCSRFDATLANIIEIVDAALARADGEPRSTDSDDPLPMAPRGFP